MKKTSVWKIIAMVLALVIGLVTMTACNDEKPKVTGTKADVQSQAEMANKLSNNQPTPVDINYSLERYNLIRMEIVERKSETCVRARMEAEMFNDPQAVREQSGRRVWDERPTKEEREGTSWDADQISL